MPRRLSDYRESFSRFLRQPEQYIGVAPTGTNYLVDPNAANLLLAVPFTKEHGLRDVSHLIRGSGSEYTSFTYNRISNSHIIGHETCFYDSCLRLPHTSYTNVLNIGTTNLPAANDELGTADFTIECWMKFDTFDFESQLDICYPAMIDNLSNTAADVPYILITGDSWATASERRGIQVRHAGTQVGTSTLITSTNSILSPKLWYHIAITRQGNTFRICVGSRETTGTSSVAIDNIAAGNPIGNAGNVQASGTSTRDFLGYNYIWFTRQFNKGRMPVGVYVQDFRFYRGIAKYTTSTYKVPEPIFVY